MGEVCYLAGVLAGLCSENEGCHLARLQGGRGLPSLDEIKEAKRKLDEAFKGIG